MLGGRLSHLLKPFPLSASEAAGVLPRGVLGHFSYCGKMQIDPSPHKPVVARRDGEVVGAGAVYSEISLSWFSISLLQEIPAMSIPPSLQV